MGYIGRKFRVSLKLFTALIVIVLGLAVSAPVYAADVPAKGLLITPLRSYINIDAGASKKATLTVANLTDKTIDIDFTLQQFSVADYTYDYRFEPAANDWLKLDTNHIKLDPGKSQNIGYDLQIPGGTAPGGQYFTILATTQFNNGSINSEVQAASLLYVTVNGNLIQTTSLKKSSITKFSFGRSLNYDLDVANTGNTHFYIYTSGHLNWFFKSSSAQAVDETAHILLPGTIRSVSASIPPPLLPGIYKAVYGYRTDVNEHVSRTSKVIYIPPWSIVATLIIVYLVVRRFKKR